MKDKDMTNRLIKYAKAQPNKGQSVKRFNHIINQGLQAEWLVLKGEYVRVAY